MRSNSDSNVPISSSTFDGNLGHRLMTAYGRRDRLHLRQCSRSPTSTFIGNVARSESDSVGGTVYGGGSVNVGTLLVTGSTFSGNLATNGYCPGHGGGIVSQWHALGRPTPRSTATPRRVLKAISAAASPTRGIMSLTYVTADDNSAATGGGVAMILGSATAGSSIDSIFQNSQGGNVSVVAGNFRSLGHNLFSDDPNVSLDPTDLVNTDPLLGPLGSNGGPTQTQALLPGSPAINKGIAVAGITTDQRGTPRPRHRATDIGEFQVHPTHSSRVSGSFNSLTDPPVLVLALNMLLDASRAESLVFAPGMAEAQHELGPIAAPILTTNQACKA